MKQAKLFSIFVFAVVLVYGGICFYLLPQATFQGDLTRIGLMPEIEFGWRMPQPSIDVKLLQQSSMKNADVLVIGDSFSENLGSHDLSHVWQTILTKHHFKVRTEKWSTVKGICNDFMPWLKDQGFNGKYVIFESVERALNTNLNNSVNCEYVQYRPNQLNESLQSVPEVSFDIKYGNYSGKLSTALYMQMNIFKYKLAKQNPDFQYISISNNVNLVHVVDGCKLFSHNNCEEALFLNEDNIDDIDDSALQSISTLNSRLSGVTPIWVIVPNKSTAYLYRNKQFWNKIEQKFQAPNLLRMTQQALQQNVVDLYPANNTHFSTAGYLLMGEMIFNNIKHTSSESY